MLHDPIFLYKNHSLSHTQESAVSKQWVRFHNIVCMLHELLFFSLENSQVKSVLWSCGVFALGCVKSDCHARLPAILMYSFMSCRVPKAACETTRLGHAAEHCIRECSRCKLLASRLHPPHYSSRHQNQQHSARWGDGGSCRRLWARKAHQPTRNSCHHHCRRNSWLFASWWDFPSTVTTVQCWVAGLQFVSIKGVWVGRCFPIHM